MKSFVPLESNPEVFNAFLQNLGIEDLEFTDVYGLDPDLLAFIPRPVHAIVLVFPVSETYENYRKLEDSKELLPSQANWSPQTIRNACGTMAIIHALANSVPASKLGSGAGSKLIEQFKALDATQRPQFLEESDDLESIHGSVANKGDTKAPDAEASSENHYVCIAKSGSELVELDGRRKGPILRAKGVTEEDVLAIPQTIDVIREFIDRESGNSQFAILALVDKND